MWTSRYLPARPRLLGLGLLFLLSLGLTALLLHVQNCPRHRTISQPTADLPGIPVRLHISGTEGAIVRLDGQVLGPIPLSVQLHLRGPRRVLLSAWRHGHRPYFGELMLRPAGASIIEQEIWLPSYRLLDTEPHPSVYCSH